MPTRIVLNQTVGSVPKLFSREETPRNAHPPTSSEKPSVRSLRGPTYAGPSGNSGGSNSRPLPGFRSSILRELNVRGKNNSSLYATEERRMLAAARDDIRASPRLLGYLFSIIAGAVMLVSVVQFYRQRTESPDLDIRDDDPLRDFYFFSSGAVYRWKLWGAIFMSSTGVGLSLFSVAAHFDTVLAPSVWIAFFRDGSLAERNWILFLILFWAAAVHICTSALSVGESQANVFFTTWIAFGSTAMNFGVWRESAGLPPVMMQVTVRQSRETTHNWLWICFFSLIFAGAATDMYFNRRNLELRFQGQSLNLITKDWMIILSVVWSEVALCIAAITLNEGLHTTWILPCVLKRESDNYRCVLGWHQLEGLFITLSTGCKFWVILEYAAVDGMIPGLSNAYFGVWGSFFNAVFALGTWLRENRNTEFLVREDDTGDTVTAPNKEESTLAAPSRK